MQSAQRASVANEWHVFPTTDKDAVGQSNPSIKASHFCLHTQREGKLEQSQIIFESGPEQSERHPSPSQFSISGLNISSPQVNGRIDLLFNSHQEIYSLKS